MKTFRATITIIEDFQAEDEESARDQANEWQESLATSNDGSEILANQDIDIEEVAPGEAGE